jgi:hypothetical protein
MKTKMYTIYDIKAKVYNKPFYVINEQVAIRMANDLLTDKSADVSKHPEDYVMIELGEYDDNTATFDLNKIHNVLFNFMDIPSPEPEYTLTEAGAQHS